MPKGYQHAQNLFTAAAYACTMVVISTGSRTGVLHDNRDTPCAGSTHHVIVETFGNDTICDVHARAGAVLETWPIACVINGLESLDTCLFPPAGMLLNLTVSCDATQPAVVDQDDWAVLSNATTFSALIDDIDRVLQSRIPLGYPMDRAQEVRVCEKE